MNAMEIKMVDILKDLRDNHCVTGIKAEFEAEGTRLEEVLRLKEVVMKAGLELTIKIGGCEALRDMYDCRNIGVERIVAPMVESAFALKKFLLAIRKAFTEKERENTLFAVNIETITSCKNFDAMLALPDINYLDGIVIGRTDLSGSLGMRSDEINDAKIFELASAILVKSKSAGLENAIGGGVSAHSLPFFRNLPPGTIDRYETRKVIFKCPEALDGDADEGIAKAVGFELLWLKNKHEYYGAIFFEDDKRIKELEQRSRHKIVEVTEQVEYIQ